jgi:hypothetical protein
LRQIWPLLIGLDPGRRRSNEANVARFRTSSHERRALEGAGESRAAPQFIIADRRNLAW